MSKKILAILPLTFLLVPLFFIQIASADFSNCSVLNETGKTYLLTADIIDSNVTNCMDVQASNITLDCQGHTIDGLGTLNTNGIYINGFSNIIIKNCYVSEWHRGTYLTSSENTTIQNNTFTLMSGGGFSAGVFLQSSNSKNIISNNTFNANGGFSIDNEGSNNIFTDNIIKGSTGNGIWSGGSSNLFKNNTISDAYYYGITLSSTSNNNITNNIISSNRYGILMDSGSNDIVFNNTIQGNTDYGIFIQYPTNAKVYNNLLNNTNNYGRFGTDINFWNTTQQTGTRIFSDGTQIGGNYWTNSAGTGYSDTCDATLDGFCDTPYTLATDNIDYLPLTSNEFTPYISITFNYSSIAFTNLTSPSNNNSAPNQLDRIYNVSVDTNANYKVEANGTNLTKSGDSIAISNLRMDINSTKTDIAVGSSVALSTSPQTIDNNISSTNTADYHGYWLTIPVKQSSGSYSSTVTITYSNI